MTRGIPTGIPNLPAGGFVCSLFPRLAFDQNQTVRLLMGDPEHPCRLSPLNGGPEFPVE